METAKRGRHNPVRSVKVLLALEVRIPVGIL